MENKVQAGDVIRIITDGAESLDWVKKGMIMLVEEITECTQSAYGTICSPYGSVYKGFSRNYFEIIARAIKPEPAEPGETLHEMARRMCDAYQGGCDGCPIDYGVCCPVSVYAHTTADEMESKLSALRDWAKQNPPKPVKTYKDDFFEKYPDAPRTPTGYPHCSVGNIYPICNGKKCEYCGDMKKSKDWCKPLGYWEGK